MFLAFVRMIKTVRDYRRVYNELTELSPRELADIGLDRADIERVAAGGFTRS